MNPIITLTTDFGLKDYYVGAMKGVIFSINPDARIIDISHEIPAHDVFYGAFTLRNLYRYFPEGTIHVAVVDPGVGGKRKPVVVRADRNIFVGPDNGIFTFIYRESKSVKVVEVTNSQYMLSNVSSTFHGRDIFAPAAAHLSLGVSVEDLGKRARKPVELPIKEPIVSKNEIIGEFIHEDIFGNLVTNIPSSLLRPESIFFIGKTVVKGLSKSYVDAPKGKLLAVAGSAGFLELSVNRGRASDFIEKSKKLRVKI